MDARRYPVLQPGGSKPTRPVSFIVVHFSDDYFHNVLRSECVRDPFNQLVTIDNRNNVFYDNLSQAINAGLDQVRHELLAVVHEDVLLPSGWQEQLESSLAELEKADPDWGLLGSAGWTKGEGEAPVGHWSDPWGFSNTLLHRSFEAVRTIDEHLMILRKSCGIRFDPLLPSIHNIGRDLAATLRERDLKTYVINAPSIHKYADESGRRIEVPEGSPKIECRRLPSFLADLACCNDYLYQKWPEWRPGDFEEPDWNLADFREYVHRRMKQPIVLLSRGGSGSRLLSWLAQDAGVFLGNELNQSGDSMEMVEDLYMGVLNKYQRRAPWQRERIVPSIRLAAARMLECAGPSAGLWGWKLPESMLLLPEIQRAFGEARFIHLIRDPLTTCLRRTHMTARFDNAIGRVAIREAYRHCRRNLVQSLQDSPGLHMAYTTIHQLETVRDYAQRHLGDRYMEIRFEEVLGDPTAVLARVGDWLGTAARGDKLEGEVDPERAARPAARYRYPREVEEAVARALAELRRRLGYVADTKPDLARSLAEQTTGPEPAPEE